MLITEYNSAPVTIATSVLLTFGLKKAERPYVPKAPALICEL